MTASRYAWITLTFMVLAGIVHGKLEFTSTESITEAKPEDSECSAIFRFKNVGKRPIKIETIKSSCACLVLSWSKKAYAPKEDGELKVKLIFGPAQGKFIKSFRIKTDEVGENIYKLQIGANIPTVVKITPKYPVRWSLGDPPAGKRIRIDIVHDSPIRVVKVTSSNKSFHASVRAVRVGKEYLVTVFPPNTEAVGHATLSIEFDFPADRHRVHLVACWVRHREGEKKSWGSTF